MSCPHLKSLKDFAGRIKIAVQKYQEGNKQCHFCKKRDLTLFVCLEQKCNFVGCGNGTKNHITIHMQKTRHFICYFLNESAIICLKCNKEFPQKKNALRDPASQDNKNKAIETPLLLEEPDFLDEDFKPKGLCGLSNMGNTCYMNSALQSLSNCPPLTQFFLKCELSGRTSDQGNSSVAAEYCKLMRRLWDIERHKFFTPAGLARSFRQIYPQFRGYSQQDSQEFLRCIMDRLHEELKKPVMASSPSKKPLYAQDNHYNNHNRKLVGGRAGSDNRTKRAETEHDKHFSGQKNDRMEQNANIDSERKEDQGAIEYHSIIADVFNGKLTSSVQCLACQRMSTTIENFQDLSLPIPDKDDLIRIHTHGSPQSLSCSPELQETGWISNFYDWLRSWFVGPQVSLQDCLAAFFAKDELKGDNMYNCEKCNKLRNGVKYLRVQTLPEVLCIHLKRFRHEVYYSSKINSYVLFPVNGLELKNFIGKDCSSKSTTYDLCAVITHFGSVGGGHYVCYAKNCVNNKWYEFNDSQVSEVTEYEVQSAEAYCLFYNKRPSSEQRFRAIVSENKQLNKSLSTSDGVFISQEWLIRFETCVEPGQISNFDFLCCHGDVPPILMPNIRRFVLLISKDMWRTLQSRFGGGPEVHALVECRICRELQKRREFELNMFSRLHDEFQKDPDPELAYCLSINWYKRWNAFTKEEEQEPPGPIDNSDILDERGNELILKEESDYGLVSEKTWRFLVFRYKGGPEFKIEKSKEPTTTQPDDKPNGE